MRKYQLASADIINSASGRILSRRASLWAYFVVHSLAFLAEDGRMAWVLPRSLSQSDYGRQLVTWLCGRFEAVTIISLQKRLFVTDGADELVDILLCRKYQKNKSDQVQPTIAYASSLAELQQKLNDGIENRRTLSVEISSGREELLTVSEREALDKYASAVGTYALGEIASIHIGIVTGLTRYFVLKPSALADAQLTSEMCIPLLTRTLYARGLSWQQADLLQSIKSDHRIYLVRPDIESTQRYWAAFPSPLRNSIATFKKRAVWNAPDDGRTPDAFFFGLVDNGPRLVLNDARTNSNNSLHRIFFKDLINEDARRTLALLFLSSYVQVSGELTGRVCGSGGLKFELADAAKLKIALPSGGLAPALLAELWPKIDLLLRNGAEKEAVLHVDRAIQVAVMHRLSSRTIGVVQGILTKLRNARR
jgi:hypothetical protein